MTPFDRIAIALLSFALAATASAQEILLPGDDIAMDQPRILFGLEDPAVPGEIFGPPFFNDALLDTGANGIVLAELAYFDPDIFDFDPDFYPVAQRGDGSFVQFEEIGVAGEVFFDVLEPFHLNFAAAAATTHVIPNARILGAPELNAGSFAAIIGMPAMQGRVISQNLRPIVDLEFIEVEFISSLPAPTPSTYTISMSMLPAEFTGQQEPTDPLPTYADLPLVNVSTSDEGLGAAGSLLLDTGAQNTILSANLAEAMGLILDPDDPNTDVLGFLEVGGIGGTVEMPIVEIDRLVVPTNEGVDLVFTNLQVGVLDVAGLDGVLGMNILTSGYADLILGEELPEPGEFGAFGDIFLDFTNPTTGILRLDVNPAFVPEPSSAAFLTIAASALLLRRRRRARLSVSAL